MKVYALLVLIVLNIIIINAEAHSLFNSETNRIAGYKIQIATDPEIPSEGDNTKIMLAVTDRDGNELNEVILSLIILQGDRVELEYGPELVKNGHLAIDHRFSKPGIYIVEVSIYENDKIITTKFDIGVTRTLSMIFISLVIVGVFAPVGLIVAIKLFKQKR